MLLKQVGINPIVVHGGGPQIGHMLERLGIKSRFVDGLRVTDRETMEVVEMVLAGTINKAAGGGDQRRGRLRHRAHRQGWRADPRQKLVRSRIEGGARIEVDLGFVGEPEQVDGGRARHLPAIRHHPGHRARSGSAPPARPTTSTPTRSPARSPPRSRRPVCLLLTDVAGVLDADKRLLSEITAGAARRMIADGVISGGMIPKVETCLDAVDGGVEAAVILDGRVPHAILLELFTDTSGAGTLIRAG